MASLEEVIASKDAEAIKRKRTAIQSMINVVRNSLEKLLVKTVAGAYDHAKIQRVRAQGEHAKLIKYHQNFCLAHEAYVEQRKTGDSAEQEIALAETDDKHYNDVVGKIYDTLEIFESYDAHR